MPELPDDLWCLIHEHAAAMVIQRRLRRCIESDFGRLPELSDYFVAGVPAILSANDNPGFIHHHHVIWFMDGSHVNQMFV